LLQFIFRVASLTAEHKSCAHGGFAAWLSPSSAPVRIRKELNGAFFFEQSLLSKRITQ
jgi:hypothetical protein